MRDAIAHVASLRGTVNETEIPSAAAAVTEEMIRPVITTRARSDLDEATLPRHLPCIATGYTMNKKTNGQSDRPLQ